MNPRVEIPYKQNACLSVRLFVSVFMFFGYMASPTQATFGQSQPEGARILAIHLKGRLDEDPESGYNKLAKAVIPAAMYQNMYQRYPFARAVRDFKKAKRVCLFPTSQSALNLLYPDTNISVLESDAIDTVSAHLISSTLGTPFSNFEELEEKTIAAQHAVGVPNILSERYGVKVIRTPDDLSALRMVLAGHVDAMYGWLPDIFIIAKQNNLPRPSFDPDFVLYQTTTHFVCKRFYGHEVIIDTINRNLKLMKKSGALREILGKHARIAK
ncbi:MAG: hypothetical protein AB3N28_11125 [Kordiimonas sp.]